MTNITAPELTGMNTYVLVICVIAMDILAVINNVIIIAIICSSARFRDISGSLIVNQAVADMGVALTMLLYSVGDETAYHGVHLQLSVGWMRLAVFVFYSSSMQMLAAIALNLCVAICYPHHYAKLSKRTRILSLILGSWTLNILLGLLDLYSDTFTKTLALPHMFVADQRWSEWWIIALDLLALLGVPLAVAVVSFMKIFWYTRHVADSRSLSSRTGKYVRQALSILVIGIIYMLTFTPVVVTQIVLKTRTATSYVDSVIALTVVIVNYSYMVLKLPLFLLMFRPYRECVKRVMCCSRGRIHDVNEHRASSENKATHGTDTSK